jgi:glycerol-3-phosphate dehydrogenase
MARGVDDVLARRSRLLFLDAAKAATLADDVATLLAEETGRQVDTQAFKDLAAQYQRLP